MKTFKILDLCCCQGLASMGLALACGDKNVRFEITGVDIDDQPRYPFRFVRSCAVEYLYHRSDEYDFIFASPPCQEFSVATPMEIRKNLSTGQILIQIRDFLRNCPIPSVIENVRSAPIRPDVRLVGHYFDLPILRLRRFELNNFWILSPPYRGQCGVSPLSDFYTLAGKGAKRDTIVAWSNAIGAFWADRHGLAQGIPPAYSRYILASYLDQIL